MSLRLRTTKHRRRTKVPAPTLETRTTDSGQSESPASTIPNFNYGYYIDRMLEAIRSQWLRPPVGNDVENVVHFYIRSDGAIEALEMVEPSGVTSFDMAGMRAVRSARLPATAPKLPPPAPGCDSHLPLNWNDTEPTTVSLPLHTSRR